MYSHRLLLYPFASVTYMQRLLALLGANTIAYYAHNEVSGSSALDSGPSARHGTYTNATLNQAAAYDRAFTLAGTGYVTLPASVGTAFNGAVGSAGQWVRVAAYATWRDATIRRSLIVQADSNNRIVLLKDSSNTHILQAQYSAGGVAKTASLAQIPTLWSGFVHLGMTWSKSNDRMRLYINGVQSGADVTGLGTFSGTPTTLLIGAGNTVPSQPWVGGLDDCFLATRELTAAEMLIIGGQLPRALVVYEGDSRTVGTGATMATNYPSQLASGLATNGKMTNISTSGETVATMITQISSQLTPLYGAGYTKNIAVMWGGVNDNTTAATMFSRIQQWHTDARAAGFRTIVCTEIDCQSAAHAAWHATEYQALNVLLRAAYPAGEIADLGADARLQNALDTTYFNADKTHLTEAGYTVVAGIVATTLAGYLA